MKYVIAGLVVVGWTTGLLAQTGTLKEARLRWLRGNYVEAQTLYETLAKDPKQAVAATLGLSRALQSQGEYDQALTIVEKLLAAKDDSADLHARRGELLHLRGRYDEALKAADKALELTKDHFAARWVRAQVYRDTGEMKKADADCRWFVRTYTQRSQEDNDIKDPDELLIVGQAGTENARWHSLSDQFGVILNDVYNDALKADKDFWLAEATAGMLLLEKYNRADAVDSFDKALKINPRAAEAFVGKGYSALQRYEVKDAEQHAQQALKINPRLPEALRLRADVNLVSGDLVAARRDLDAARKINPRDESTLGQLAACLFLQKKKTEFEAALAEAEKNNTRCGIFYYELAERLDRRHYFDIAEGYYKKAIELLPMVPYAQNALGMLYMRMGREAEARTILTKAFDADRFNVLVSNTLKVLRHLDKYETIKTDHFELRYDPKTDPALARYMAEYLEETYDHLAGVFHYRPKGPILFEVFNNHEMFSGRTVALPDLHTIGACTGRMVAMVSPRGKGIRKPFNWGRVVRHELVHIFNLEQTNFQIPHWFTEGLAVINEGYPRPQPWNQLLLERVPKGELMNLDTIDLGFIRPRSPLDWHMAYCQSQLYVEYMQEKYGPQTVGEMLVAYRDGLDTGAAVAKVCKVNKETFEKGYRTYLDGVVAKVKGKPPEKVMTLRELEEAHEKNPDDPDIAARLAEQYLGRRRRADARRLVEKVLEAHKTHGLATYVKARLLRDAGDDDEARKLLEAALDPKAPDAKVLLALGNLHFEASQFDKAAEVFEMGRKAEPLDSKWLTELVRVYAQAKNQAKLIDVMKELVPTDADELDLRKRLAKMLIEAGRNAEAEQYARQVLEIDVMDNDGQQVLDKALRAQKKDAEADRIRKLLTP